ncbi:MAG TPA: ATP-binding protein [Gaiellaceae bacterium]
MTGKEAETGRAETAHDTPLLDATARRFGRVAHGVGDPAAALARARARARLVASRDGDAESTRFAALALAADLVVSFALERDWERAELDALVADLAATLELATETVTLEVFARAVADTRFLEPLPRLVIATQLRLLTAFCAVDDASVWLGDSRSRPQLIASVGREPTRSARFAAQSALAGEALRPGALLRAFPIVRWEQVEGALVLRSPRRDAGRAAALAAELVPRIAPALERERLLTRIREREAALVEAAERRLARVGFDLHDGPLQEVFALGGELRLFKEQLQRIVAGDRAGPLILGRVDDLEARLIALEAELRELARSLESSAVLRTPLPELLKKEVHELEERSRLSVTLRLDGDLETLTHSQTIALLRLVQEGLANVETHSGAATATVTVTASVDELRAEIVDEGRGFEVERTLVDAARGGRLGLVGMSERTRLLGGRLDLESRPGGPTRVSAVIPRWRPGDAES